MERGVERRRGVRGGILSLVQIINEHDRALEYELMTRTGRTLTEYMEMGAAGMVALLSFINYLPKESVLYGILEPGDESREWYMPYKTNQMIADLKKRLAEIDAPKETASIPMATANPVGSYCPDCGSPCNVGAKFCPRCGKTL